MRSIGLRVPLARRLVTGRALPLRTAVPLVRLEEHGARGQHNHQQQQGGALPARRWAVIGVRELHGSPPRLAEIIMNVPNMGDSITEGTLQSWQKQVGESVKVDDVVAVIETDKVSVDIRAKDAGVLVAQYAKADETVQVGAQLLKIDTSAAPGSVAPSPPQPSATAAAASPPAPQQSAPATASAANPEAAAHGRKPLIKFLGKRSLLKQQQAGSTAVAAPGKQQAAAPPVRYEDIKGTPGAKTFSELPPLFGRPALSKEEIEAVESGGAL